MPDPTPIALVDDDAAYAGAQQRLAREHGFELTWFRNWESAREAIRSRQFKLVILDAKGQLDEGTPTEDIAHLHQARNDLAEWRGQNVHIPYVICTGFDEGHTANLRNEKRYLKGNEEEMFAEIKRIIDGSREEALRHRYADVLEVLRRPWFDASAEGLFMEALVFVDRGDRSGRDRLFLNPLRQVVEHFFRAAHAQGLLPDALVKPVLNQRLCALFLSGHVVDFPSRTLVQWRFWSVSPLLPKLLADALENVLRVTNWGSHAMVRQATAEDTNYLADNEDAFHAHGGSPYLLSAVVFQLMDILVFFKRYLDEHPDPIANRSALRMEDPGLYLNRQPNAQHGTREAVTVTRAPGKPHAHAGDCYINARLVAQHGLQHGDTVDITIEPSTRIPRSFQAVSITKHTASSSQ